MQYIVGGSVMSGFGFNVNTLVPEVELMEKKSEQAIMMLLYTDAKLLEKYAKTHRRWKDRTGMARKTITAVPGKTATGYRIKLAHGVNYGIWLELANEKRYAIINEAINTEGPQILKDFQGLMEKIT